MTNRIRILLAALAALVGAGGITIAVVSDDDGQGHKSHTVTIHVDGVDADVKADDALTLSPAAQAQRDQLAKTADQVAPGADGSTALYGAELANPLERDPAPAPAETGGAAQDWPGCRTQFVRNQSYRTAGIKLQGIALHYTVSADTPGWADNDALTARANSLVAGVSWHFQIGRQDGNCTYNVPISMKAWHAAGANSATVGIEIHATGQEASYVEGAGKARLLKVVREIERRTGIPNQKGEGHCVGSTFVITKPGLFRHVDFGACGGGHVDTGPFPDPRPMVIAGVRALELKPITKRDRGACRRAHAFGRRQHHTAAGRRRQDDRRERLKHRGMKCVRGKVVRR